ncbi:MAG TPA: ABC transporter permease, partial [Vicinamibacterales bacterium]|nr:ABC transporter permease [Vicinamibacterales bacterium]
MPNLRLALRTLFKSPFITMVAILSLALGIGANSAIFSMFDQMILRPLPVPAPEHLVNFKSPGPKPGSNSCGQAGSCEEIFSYPMFKDLEAAQTTFTGIAAHRNFGGSLGYQGTSLSGNGLLVSGSYFPVLQLTPALGRLLTPDDDKTIGSHFVVVLSHDYWRTRFDMNPAVLNETLVVNGQAMTIVGVAPRGFKGTTLGDMPDVFVPITMRGLMQPGFNGFQNRRQYWAYLFGRLKPGVTIEQATVAINGPYRSIINDVEAPLQKGMSDQTMARFKAKQITTEPGHRGQSSFDDEARAPLMILLAVTGTVLLIACANIANLLLVRGAGRAAEMAVRLSIGANRRELITQLLTESILLAAFGAVGGLLVGKWTLDLIASFMPVDDQGIVSFSLSPSMIIFAAITAVATGIAFGLFPALQSTRPDLAAIMKNQAGQPGGAKAARRFRTTLATVQIAMSMALLVPAGLFAKSLFNVSRVDLGLKTDHLVLFSLAPELNSYTTERTRQLFERIEDELAAIPGVTGVVATMVPVLAGDNWGNSLAVEGFEAG